MPNTLLFTLVFTLLYCLIVADSRIYNEVYIKTVKVDVLFTITATSWLSLCLNYFCNMNFFITLLIFFALLLGAEMLLYHYRVKSLIKSAENRITDVDSVFENKIGTIETRVNGNYYLGTIFLNNSEQQIMVYSTETFEHGDKFRIVGFEGSKIMAEKEFGTDFVNDDSENKKE